MAIVTEAYATAALADLGLSAAQLARLPDAIASAQAALEAWCLGRRFDLTDYDRVLDVSWDGNLMLPDLPIAGIDRLSARETAALSVRNTSSTVQRATVALAYADGADPWDGLATSLPTGLTLRSVASGVATTTTIAFADAVTLDDLAAAIEAVGGWTAEVSGGFGAWASTELVDPGLAAGAAGAGVDLTLFAEDLGPGSLLVDRAAGMVRLQRLPRRDLFFSYVGAVGDESPAWGRVRVAYSAGYAAARMPADLQAACVEAVKGLLTGQGVDPNLLSERGGSYAYQLRDAAAVGAQLPEAARRLAAPYRMLRA